MPTCGVLAGIYPLFALECFLKLIATFYAHTAFLEIKKMHQLGLIEYANYAHAIIQGGVGIPETKCGWITKLIMFLISMVFNLQTAFLCFFTFDFFRFYETPTDTIVIPEKFPEDFQETDDVCPICTVCPEILVLGCRHIMCCECLNMLPIKNCPKCRHPIDMALVKQRSARTTN